MNKGGIFDTIFYSDRKRELCMKKIILSVLTALLLFSPSFAANIDILPTMSSKTNVQDRVWVGTFQLVWNDFMDKIAFNQIKFPAGTPVIVNELNRQDFTEEDISSRSYYKYLGNIQKNTKKVIAKAIKRKFNETSDILDQLDLTPSKQRFIVYAMLKKDFKFVVPFDKLGKAPFRNMEAEYFGISKDSRKELDNGVEVLFYDNPSDFAVKIDTEGDDEVYLYKTSNTKTFNYIYEDMLKKESAYQGNKKFAEVDELKIPNLNFFEEKIFEEICGNRVKGTNLIIDEAIESIRFNMNNAGVELKSESSILAKTTALFPIEEARLFYFNDTFVIFLKEKEKTKPYFALRVHDISKFQ